MNKYEVIGLIESGKNERVYKILRKIDKKILILKEVRFEGLVDYEKKIIENEINILGELDHPNIVKQYETFKNDSNSKQYIVMEYCEKEDLDKIILQSKHNNKIVDEQIIWEILIQVLNALIYIHNDKKIIHGNIRPRSIFIDKNYNIKLTNFLLCQKHFNDYSNSIFGTLPYMSPEMIEKKQFNDKADIWALGCSIYELVTFVSPFDAPNMDIVLRKIKKGVPKKINNIYSEYLWNIVSKMLTTDYRKRPSSSELLEECKKVISIRNKIVYIKNRNQVQAEWDQMILNVAYQIMEKEQKEKEKDKIMDINYKDLKQREQEVLKLENEKCINEVFNEMLRKNKELKAKNINKMKNEEKNDDNFNLNKNDNYNGNNNDYLNNKINQNKNNDLDNKNINNAYTNDSCVLNEIQTNNNNTSNNYNNNNINYNLNINENKMILNNNNNIIYNGNNNNEKYYSNKNNFNNNNNINENDLNKKNDNINKNQNSNNSNSNKNNNEFKSIDNKIIITETMKLYNENALKNIGQFTNTDRSNKLNKKCNIDQNNNNIINKENINNDNKFGIINNNLNNNKIINNNNGINNNNINNNQILNNNNINNNNQMINNNNNGFNNNNVNNNQMINNE